MFQFILKFKLYIISFISFYSNPTSSLEEEHDNNEFNEVN